MIKCREEAVLELFSVLAEIGGSWGFAVVQNNQLLERKAVIVQILSICSSVSDHIPTPFVRNVLVDRKDWIQRLMDAS